MLWNTMPPGGREHEITEAVSGNSKGLESRASKAIQRKEIRAVDRGSVS